MLANPTTKHPFFILSICTNRHTGEPTTAGCILYNTNRVIGSDVGDVIYLKKKKKDRENKPHRSQLGATASVKRIFTTTKNTLQENIK